MMSLLLVAYAAGVLVSVGMLTAHMGSTRILELHPKAAYPFFVALWPIFWLVGFGVILVVVWALMGTALAKR